MAQGSFSCDDAQPTKRRGFEGLVWSTYHNEISDVCLAIVGLVNASGMVTNAAFGSSWSMNVHKSSLESG